MAVLLPQAALEQAVVGRLRLAEADGGLGLGEHYCGRTYDGSPPPSCGNYYVAVWSDNQRESVGQSKTCLDQILGLYVTVTYRTGHQPWDRWVAVRDELEAMANGVIVCIGKDVWDHRVSNAANALADLRTNDAGAHTLAVGFREALCFRGADATQLVGPEWFKAALDKGDRNVGIAQRLGFFGARLIQGWANAQ